MTTLEQRIATRKAAEVLLGFVPDLLTVDMDEPHFWSCIESYCREKLGKPPELQPTRAMTYEEAIKFEREVVPFGMHAGRKVGDIDSSYWLAITETPFNLQLQRWIASRRFQDLQDDSQ